MHQINLHENVKSSYSAPTGQIFKNLGAYESPNILDLLMLRLNKWHEQSRRKVKETRYSQKMHLHTKVIFHQNICTEERS